MSFETYIIVIKDNEISERYAELSEAALSFNDIEYKRFDAITPETLDTVPELTLTNDLTKTEQACFKSHYLLWKKCVEDNKPIAIIEHDSIMVKPYPTYPRSMSFLGYRATFEGRWLMLGAAYIVFPSVAKDLIKFVTKSPMRRQVDNLLWRYFKYLKIKPFEKHHCFVVNNIGPVTIEHNK